MSLSIPMRRLFLASTVLSALWIGATVTRGDNPLEALLPSKDHAQQPQLLVLKSGQVLHGQIEGQVGGYAVNSPTGRMMIQYSDVRTAAVTLEDAYQRMAANRRNPTANDRIELAHWCVRNGLRTQAREELLAALVLEPQRLEAKRLLLQIESPATGNTTAAGPGMDLTLHSGVTRPRPQPTSGGLSRERMAEFTRQMQPLLLNTCGNAACHGGQSAGDFYLRPTARVSRLDTDANLESVLRLIDPTQPQNSPLLTAPRQPGGAHAGTFRGPKAEDQYQRLAAWVTQVARETAGDAALARQPVTNSIPEPGAIVPAAAFVPAEAVPGRLEMPTDSSAPITSPPSTLGGPEVNDAFLRNLLNESRPDAFDPEEFNRRVHGRPSTEAAAGPR